MGEREWTPHEGGCACGSVRYRLDAEPLIVHCCHCTWCQRETGSAFALNALVETSAVTLLAGNPEQVLTPSNSGKGQTIVRCPDCQIAVWSHYGGFGQRISFIRAGTLDPGHGLEPGIHIYTSTRQHWVQIPDGIPTADEYYDLRAIWSDDSRARLKAALNKA